MNLEKRIEKNFHSIQLMTFIVYNFFFFFLFYFFLKYKKNKKFLSLFKVYLDRIFFIYII